MYCAVTESSNILSDIISPETLSESLVQVTVVAGPPVEIQVRVKWGLAPLKAEFSVIFKRFFIVIAPKAEI